MAPRTKGKAADMITSGMEVEEGKEEEEYEDWLDKNREARNSIFELPGQGNEDLPERTFSKQTTIRMNKNKK